MDPLTCPADQLPGLNTEPTPICEDVAAGHAPWIVLALNDQVEALAKAGPS